ncbi:MULTISPECIES: hypothetical protein [unclassified Helicobacter]|uniref:hypothetical protein n=1 Tax=unclassified Helicobacter TaxID=2593540 RepID=UPI00051D0891|nr:MULTISPECIES: hypothetical protein [unclassified Helicobacter]
MKANMIQGKNASYNNAYYYVFNNYIYRYDGKLVDICVHIGASRCEAALKEHLENHHHKRSLS